MPRCQSCQGKTDTIIYCRLCGRGQCLECNQGGCCGKSPTDASHANVYGPPIYPDGTADDGEEGESDLPDTDVLTSEEIEKMYRDLGGSE